MSESIPRGFLFYREKLGISEPLSNGPYIAETYWGGKFVDITDIRKDGVTKRQAKTRFGLKKETKPRVLFSEYSLLLRRIENSTSNGQDNSSRLEIQSSTLRQAFAELAKGVRGIKLSEDPIVIPAPYKELFYVQSKIQRALTLAKEERLHAELGLLIEFQKRYMTETLETIEHFQTTREIDYKWVWALFPPGEPVFIGSKLTSTDNTQWCATVKHFHYPSEPNVSQSWSITVEHIEFNGTGFGRVETQLSFPSFSDVVSIDKLPAYPRRYCRDQAELERKAVARGRWYEKFCCKCRGWEEKRPITIVQEYVGPIWTETVPGTERRGPCRIIDSPSSTVEGTVIVDFERICPRNARNAVLGKTESDEGDGGDKSHAPWYKCPEIAEPAPNLSCMSPDDYLACAPLVPVFLLASREWGWVLVDHLHNIERSKEEFDRLLLPGNKKEMIRALVQGFISCSKNTEYSVQDKGQGPVFLLSGPAGCGKSMTAEAISKFFGKPLYRLTGDQLGSSVDSAVRELEKAFQLATRWDAILLLNGVYPFMTKQHDTDIEGGFLVAALLRLLKYHHGVVFFTTKQPQRIDKAFFSAVLLHIDFDSTVPETRQCIWAGLAKKIGNLELSDAQSSELAKIQLDGHQIENILRMASFYAADRARNYGRSWPAPTETSTRDCEPTRMKFEDIKNILPLAIPKEGEIPGP